MRTLCRVLKVHPSGDYAWKHQPRSARSVENQRLTGQIKQSWLHSGAVYGYRKVHAELRDLGEPCGEQRVYRLMEAEGLRSQSGYRRCPHVGGVPAVTAPNRLDRQFDVAGPNEAWVTDNTYLLTHDGWLYLAVVLDLFSRQVVGWSMQSRIDRELVLSALLMAIWRLKPKLPVLVHSHQGSQFSSEDWQSFLKAHDLVGSMSRRGNCHDNAVAESFLQLLKRERIKRKTYPTREAARQDVFDYIEMFYNRCAATATTERSRRYNLSSSS